MSETAPVEADLETLLQDIPEPLRPIARKYGPALLRMTLEEVWAWIELLASGDRTEAYLEVLRKMPPDQNDEGWEYQVKKIRKLNRENAADMELQREASSAILKALLPLALAMVGL